MFCWHKRPKWSAPYKIGPFVLEYSEGGQSGAYYKTIQDRTCPKCGKYQMVVVRPGIREE